MKYFLLLFILIPFINYSQVDWKNLQQTSSETFAYKISATQAENFIKKDSITIDVFLSQSPYKIFKSDSVDESQLAIGHYVLMSVKDNRVVADLAGVSNLFVYAVNNQHRVQLVIQGKQKNFITNAQVWVHGKPAKQDKSSGNYIIKQKYPDEALIKIYTSDDTLFSTVWAEEELYNSISEQRLNNFKNSRFVHVITWLPKQVSEIFKSKSYNAYSKAGTGTIVFNQPKYKTTDTVKLKAYIFNEHWKQYNKAANVYLEYYSNGMDKQQLLTVLKPSHAGSFIYQFPLNDTLTNDINYNIVFRDYKKRQLVRNYFKLEDYLPDEVSKVSLHSSKENYFQNDSMHFYVSATDANGLQLLDANTTLILTAENINKFYKDSMYIPDALFSQQKILQTEGETIFTFSTNNLPDADMIIDATASLKNSNNELQNAEQNIEYRKADKELLSNINNDSVVVEYKLNGENVNAKGLMISNGETVKKDSVQFPLQIKIDPFVTDYTFYLIENGIKKDSVTAQIESDYDIDLSRISYGDTLGFSLYNPKKIPVSFSIFYGNTMIASGRDDKENIVYKFKPLSKHRIYRVKWQYIWADDEKTKEDKIALLYKVLKIDIKSNQQIFPGQKDTIHINVVDYKNKPTADVNLTAVSYNNQLQKDIHVGEPPYLVKYRNKQFIIHDKFEEDDEYIIKKYPLGKHSAWLQKFGLDSLPYYQMLFPKQHYKDFVTPIREYIPQIAVHVTKNGEKQEIYLLYINKQLIYYNDVTEKTVNAYSCFPGYAKIGIRLFDKFIETDSIYIQPNYKHDIFIDIDNLDSNTYQSILPRYFTGVERNLLERSIWQLDNNYQTNNSYVWQNDKVIKLYRDITHIVGPFNINDSMHFFVPENFDIHFRFEPGYEYDISPKILRLEKKPLFPADQKQILLKKVLFPEWILGDTVVDHPGISYTKPAYQPYLKINYYNSYYNSAGKGKLFFTIQKDSIPKYIVLYNEDDKKNSLIADGSRNRLNNIIPGYYSLLIVTKNFNVCRISHLLIKPDTTLCIKTEKYVFEKNDSLINELMKEDEEPVKKQVVINNTNQQYNYYEKGEALINGKIMDAKGNYPVPFATITIKGTRTSVAASADGTFSISNIKSGKITLIISAVGYLTKELSVDAENANASFLNISLQVTSSALSEVVVTGYGVSMRKELTGAITTIRGQELTNSIQGRVSGLSISNEGAPGSTYDIIIRGTSSIANGQNPIYVVDGIVYDKMPANITPDMIADITILKGEEAMATYGSRATDGAVIISTKLKNNRSQFRDYAFWQPEIFTDENGRASFVVEYPDNITGWQTYVLAMDKKRRMGKAVSYVKSYKPLSAQLSMPQFLIEGDSVQIVGKLFNYSNDNYTVQSSFSINGNQFQQTQTTLLSKSSEIKKQDAVAVSSTDSLKASFSLQTSTGFKDAEERKIPVLKKGTEEATGNFWILQNDTTVNFKADERSDKIELYAQNNTLDILLNEIEHLKQYPYFCMEQTASKLKGLLAEQKIKQALNQSFKEEKAIRLLIQKLQKTQLYDGGWSWWENGKSNLYITNYVINALLPLRSDVAIETNIRNGLLYLQNQLDYLHKDELLTTLATMSNANHLIDYTSWINKIYFDSLTQYQQWLFIKIKQQQKLDYTNELNKILRKSIPGILGSLHWGEDNYRWYNDANAATTLAFEVLQNDKEHNEALKDIMQYFLEQRSKGYWMNTVQSASIVSTVLPYILSTNKNFNQQAILNVSGDTSFSIKNFPYQKTFNQTSIKNLNVSKTGGGLMYCTLYQHYWNNNPELFDKFFNINSSFEKNRNAITTLQAGEVTKMKVEINVLKEADYVMIEIPIPAGCTYNDRTQDDWNVHKEFLKNKVVLFAEHLEKGLHSYTINLEPRYNGSYTLNPAKASLMYFPTFYGRNEMKKVSIQ